MGLGDIHHMNAVKTLLAACINGVSVVVFVVGGQGGLAARRWRWRSAAIAGGYLGARVGRRLPRWIRAVVVVIGFGLAGYYFYKQIVG